MCTDSDVLVVVNKESEFANLPETFPGKMIVDLVRMWDKLDYNGNYEGISWGNINANPAQADLIESDMTTTEF